MTTTDRILDLIDAGLQSSTEAGQSLGDPDLCARCQHTPHADDSDFCAGCRAYLLGDSDVDTRQPPDNTERLLLLSDMILYGNAYTTAGRRVDPRTVRRTNPVLIPRPTPMFTWRVGAAPLVEGDVDVARYNVETIGTLGGIYRCLIAPGYPRSNILAIANLLHLLTAPFTGSVQRPYYVGGIVDAERARLVGEMIMSQISERAPFSHITAS